MCSLLPPTLGRNNSIVYSAVLRLVTEGALCPVLMTSGHASEYDSGRGRWCIKIERLHWLRRPRVDLHCDRVVEVFQMWSHNTRTYIVHAIEVSHEVCKYSGVCIDTNFDEILDLTRSHNKRAFIL